MIAGMQSKIQGTITIWSSFRTFKHNFRSRQAHPRLCISRKFQSPANWINSFHLKALEAKLQLTTLLIALFNENEAFMQSHRFSWFQIALAITNSELNVIKLRSGTSKSSALLSLVKMFTKSLFHSIFRPFLPFHLQCKYFSTTSGVYVRKINVELCHSARELPPRESTAASHGDSNFRRRDSQLEDDGLYWLYFLHVPSPPSPPHRFTRYMSLEHLCH